MANEKKEPKWANDNWVSRKPSDDICCKDCMFRLPDIVDGKEITKRYTFGICQVFPGGTENKPQEVLWKKAKCPYYVSEKD